MESLKKRAAVIGAGVCGIAALRNLTDPVGDIEPVAFERSSSFGGQWNFTEAGPCDQFGYPPSSAIYSGLRTNIPKQLMEFPGFPHHPHLPTFSTREDIYEYLERFVKEYNLLKYIKFNTIVLNLEPSDTSDNRTKWLVTYSDVRCPSQSTTEEFDAVIVCNGNSVFPNMPSIACLNRFEGRVLHSRDYRRPDVFKDKTVAVLGASYSGKDVGRQLSDYATKVYIIHKGSPMSVKFQSNVEEKITWIKSADDTSLILENDMKVEIDVIIFCTGYTYKFPFLSRNVISIKNEQVKPLYKHVMHANYHTLFFITVWKIIAPFPISFHLARFARAVIDGLANIPSKQEICQDIKKDVTCRTENHCDGRKYHYMNKLQWCLARELSEIGRIEYLSEDLETFWNFFEKHIEMDYLENWKYDYVLSDNKILKVLRN